MGGAIFVMDGGMLTIGGNTEVRDNGVTGGARGGTGAQAGSAFGAGIFMQGTSSTLAFVPGAGATQTFADAIADQTGSGGTGANAGSILLVKGGDGRLVLSGTNTYSGGTRVTGGTLSISSDQNLGAVAGTLALDGGTLQTTAAVTTMRAITIENAARFQTDADFTATGVISGTGGLAKTGAGTLTLAGANTYSGGTSLSARQGVGVFRCQSGRIRRARLRRRHFASHRHSFHVHAAFQSFGARTAAASTSSRAMRPSASVRR